MKRPKRFVFDLPDDVAEALERVRVVHGFRSHAATLRALIRHVDDNPEAGPLPPRVALSGKPLTVRTPDRYSVVAPDVLTPGPVTFVGPVVDRGGGVFTQDVTFGPVAAKPGSRLKKR